MENGDQLIFNSGGTAWIQFICFNGTFGKHEKPTWYVFPVCAFNAQALACYTLPLEKAQRLYIVSIISTKENSKIYYKYTKFLCTPPTNNSTWSPCHNKSICGQIYHLPTTVNQFQSLTFVLMSKTNPCLPASYSPNSRIIFEASLMYSYAQSLGSALAVTTSILAFISLLANKSVWAPPHARHPARHWGVLNKSGMGLASESGGETR